MMTGGARGEKWINRGDEVRGLKSRKNKVPEVQACNEIGQRF